MPKKTKSSAKPKGETKSPSNNRKIPVDMKNLGFTGRVAREWKLIFASFVVGTLVMVIIAVGADSYGLYKDVLAQRTKRETVQKQIGKWERVVESYPDYRDGYYSLSLLYYQIKDKQKALYYLDRALEIDPNFVQGRNFREEITGK